MKVVSTISAAVVALAVVTAPALAQLPGQPAYAIPKGTGLGINADFGLQLDPSVPGGSNNLALRATLGLPMIKFTAAFQPSMLDAPESAILAGASFQLIPMPVSIRLQATAAYGLDFNNITAVPGLVIALNVPSIAISIEPWVMPSLRVTRIDATSTTSTDFGVSAGVNLGLPGGLGGHVALDLTRVGGLVGSTNVITGGIGVHYNISVPGLGMVPGM